MYAGALYRGLKIPCSFCNAKCATDDFVYLPASRIALSTKNPQRAVISAPSHLFVGHGWEENIELSGMLGQRKQIFHKEKTDPNIYYFGTYEVVKVVRNGVPRAHEWVDIGEPKKAGVSCLHVSWLSL